MGRSRLLVAAALVVVGLGTTTAGAGLFALVGDNPTAAVVGLGTLGVLLGGGALLAVNLKTLRRVDGNTSSTREQVQRTGRRVVVLREDLVSEDGPVRRAADRALEDGRVALHALSEAARDQVARLEEHLVRFEDSVSAGRREIRAVHDFVQQLESENDRLTASLQGLADEGGGLHRLARREATSLFSLLESLHKIHSQLDLGDVLPAFGDWAIRTDLGELLVELVLRDKRTRAMELGSGLSTVLLAAAMRQVGRGHVSSVDHLPEYADATRAHLDRLGLSSWATVAVAPLVPTEVNGETYSWYDLSVVDVPEQIDLLLVDGPPSTVGKQSRYPAVPILLERLTRGAVVLLDDANRSDEQQVSERWKELVDGSSQHIPHLVGTFRLDVERPRADA